MKEAVCDECYWHAHTRGLDFHGAFQKLLGQYNKCIATRGDYFEGDQSFMCVLSIKVLIRKKTGNLFNDLLIRVLFSCIYIYIYIPIPTWMWHKVIFKRSLIGLNSEFSFSYTGWHTKANEPSLPYYLLIAWGRMIEIIPFARILVLCEMQSALFRIWTRVAVSIFYDNNHYTICPSTFLLHMSVVGWLVVWFYGVSTIFGSFNAKLNHFDKSFKKFGLV